jgi:hypothetical protein
VSVEHLPSFSAETTQPTLVLHALRGERSSTITVDDQALAREVIELTGNFSWRISDDLAPYFRGAKLGDYVIATSGMTIGRNELFLREIADNCVMELYSFEYFDCPITLDGELERARLHRLSPNLVERAKSQEQIGLTRRMVRVVPLGKTQTVQLPSTDYRFYNKASSAIVYEAPKWAVFWRDNGDAVLTFKKTGPWYLNGVGGQKYFGREGLTWQLISPRLNMRYLPPDYILDSGAPCLFLRPEVPEDELWFILGWSLTAEATRILKTAINHTRNIQSKDVERLPYPFWVDPAVKAEIIALVRTMVDDARTGRTFDRDCPEILKLDQMFAWENRSHHG